MVCGFIGQPNMPKTAGGIYQALPYLDQAPFLVVNGDIWIESNYQQFLIDLHPSDGAHLWLTPNPDYRKTGDFALVKGRVQSDPMLTYTGVGLFSPALFQVLSAGKRALTGLLHQWLSKVLSVALC